MSSEDYVFNWVAPCPICSSRNIELIEYPRPKGSEWAFECDDCGLSSGSRPTLEALEKYWNKEEVA